jgi:hypothetical protein
VPSINNAWKTKKRPLFLVMEATEDELCAEVPQPSEWKHQNLFEEVNMPVALMHRHRLRKKRV